jgi:hypothetical protein
MALANFSDLKSSIAGWLNRTDFTSVIPDFITLAEARFNRVLRTPDMETAGTVSATSESTALPTGFLEMRSVWREDSPDAPLDYFPPSHLRTMRASATNGPPTAYTIVGGNIIVAPAPAATETLGLYYYTKVTALSDSATTNWLLTAHPDLYLFASLAAAEDYGWNDARLPLLKAGVDEIIDQINDAGRKRRDGGAPLQMRAVRTIG